MHIRCSVRQKLKKTKASKTVSSVAVEAEADAVYLNLHTNGGLVVVVAGFAGFESKDGSGREKLGAFVENLGRLLRLLLLLLLPQLHALNSQLGFAAAAADDSDDSFEDPDSGPFAFPLPAFNGQHFILLVASCSRFLASLFSFLAASLLLLVQLQKL